MDVNQLRKSCDGVVLVHTGTEMTVPHSCSGGGVLRMRGVGLALAGGRMTPKGWGSDVTACDPFGAFAAPGAPGPAGRCVDTEGTPVWGA
jgi:hypothetical protein